MSAEKPLRNRKERKELARRLQSEQPRAGRGSSAATCIQRMQKALTQMNLQLANLISDLSGTTGQKIVRAIVAGERRIWSSGSQSLSVTISPARIMNLRSLPAATSSPS